MRRILVSIVLLSCSSVSAQSWIWGHWASGITNQPDGERCFARVAFDVEKKPGKATLQITCDNIFEVWVNDKRVGRGTDWQRGQRFNVAPHLKAGRNVVAVRAENEGGPAGLLAWIKVGDARVAQTGATWKTARAGVRGWRKPGFDDGAWKPAAVLAPIGDGPWGTPSFGAPGRKKPGRPQDFAPLPGFEAKEVAAGVGSLIALCLDDKDNPIVSVERGPVLRLFDDDGDGVFERSETYCDRVRSCQGLLYSRGGLYMVGNGPQGTGLYRVEESGDREEVRLIGGFNGGMGEHGPHAIIEGPGDRLYGVIGNHTSLKAKWSASSPYKAHDEGHVLPRYVDPRGHARNIKSPGGLIYSVDREGKDWRVHAAGLRNAYDIAFNRHGELFTYDSDMEWDIGMPWYRPTRVYHAIDGADFGWRTGSSKWPDIYPDSLPAAIDCGRGSPCGVVLYDGDRFPQRFQGTIFGADWAQGRILAFHLDAAGDTYKGRTEVLLSGRPLNVTDLAVTRDGALLFTCGGRGTRGSLGKLTYTRPVAKQPVRPRLGSRPGPDSSLKQLMRALRTIDEERRFSRFAAALECLRRGEWPTSTQRGGRTLMMKATAGIHRQLRGGEAAEMSAEDDMITAEAALRSATPAVQHAGLRLVQRLSLAGYEPSDAVRLAIRGLFRSGDRNADREAAMIMAAEDPTSARPLLLEALLTEKSRVEQLHLAYCLRVITDGWTAEEKESIFRWLVAAQNWSGGASFQGYVKYLRDDFEKLLDDADRQRMASLLAVKPGQASVHLVQGAPTRDFMRTLDFLRNSIGTERRSLHEGARVYQQACAACHRFGDQGVMVGPELTTAGARYNLDDLLSALVDPSRAISDQYRALDVFTKEDDVFSGLPVAETETTLTLLQGTGERVEVPVAEIDTRRFSKISGMPEGLLDSMSLEEACDLIYYLRSGQSVTPPTESTWRPLFNGKDFTGWSGDMSLWRMENGVVFGEVKGARSNTFLSTDATYGDFVLQFEMMLEEGNSGCQFRSERLPDHVMRGYQADAGAQYWGSLYEEKGRGMLNQSERVDWGPAFEKNGWNHFVVEAVGDKLRITLNGCPTTVIRDGKTASGHIGFQLHAGKRTAIQLRNVMIREP